MFAIVTDLGSLVLPARWLPKARAEVIEEQRERKAEASRDRDRLRAAYDRLTAM